MLKDNLKIELRKMDTNENYKNINSFSTQISKLESNYDQLSNFRCFDCNLIPEIALYYNDNNDYNEKIQIFYKCENNHKGIVSINEFMIKSINFDIYNILCSNNEKHIQNDRTSFIYCMQCESFFCPECHKQHENIHNKFCKINEFDYQCKFHNKSYSKYCFNCSKNICDECLNEHLNHNVKNIDNNFNIEKYIKLIKQKNIIKMLLILLMVILNIFKIV